jgi:hypothetical protein
MTKIRLAIAAAALALVGLLGGATAAAADELAPSDPDVPASASAVDHTAAPNDLAWG